MLSMFYNGWEPLVRTLVVGTCAYLALVVLLRISGKRALSKLNAFDLVVTVSLGSTLASVLISKDVALLQGILALTLLVALQLILTWLSVRSERVRELVKGEPTLLFCQGQYLQGALRRERVTRAEVLAAVRAEGVADLSKVAAVILETDGSLTVMQGQLGADRSALETVQGAPSSSREPQQGKPRERSPAG